MKLHIGRPSILLWIIHIETSKYVNWEYSFMNFNILFSANSSVIYCFVLVTVGFPIKTCSRKRTHAHPHTHIYMLCTYAFTFFKIVSSIHQSPKRRKERSKVKIQTYWFLLKSPNPWKSELDLIYLFFMKLRVPREGIMG